MKNVLQVAVLGLLLAGCGRSGDAPPGPPVGADYSAGIARVDSTPQLPICTGGYGIFCNRAPQAVRINALGEEDRLYTRALVLESQGEKLVLVTTSAIGLFAAYRGEFGVLDAPPGLELARQRIAEALGTAPRNVLIQPDHSHYAADTVGIWGGATDRAQFKASLQQLSDAMVEAAAAAEAARRPATLWVGAVEGERLQCPDDVPKCVLDSLYSFEPNLWVDNQFRVIEGRDADGARIFTLANYSTHATVLNGISEDTTISPDWTGWFAVGEDEPAAPGVCGPQGPRPCALGMATLGTLGRTDFNDATPGVADDATALDLNLARERAARLRLGYFMDLLRGNRAADCTDAAGECVRALAPMTTPGIEIAERLIREVVIQPVFYANYLPFVGLPPALTFAGSEFTASNASIERANLPPWLSANLIATPVSAVRVGTLFFGTAPGEQFPNSQQTLRDEGGVRGPELHFFLGVTNDFVGYMAPALTYDQVTAQGLTYLGGCPENAGSGQLRELVTPVLGPLGYESGRLFDEGSCPDHWILMASATIGDHVTCALAEMGAQVGFEGAPEPFCAALTATDQTR
jgi:hypothetical protein